MSTGIITMQVDYIVCFVVVVIPNIVVVVVVVFVVVVVIVITDVSLKNFTRLEIRTPRSVRSSFLSTQGGGSGGGRCQGG